MQNFFDYDSSRAKKARFARVLGHQDMEWMALICAWVLFAAGLGVVGALRSPWGWAIMGCAGPLWMVGAWSRFLRDIPPATGAQTIDGVLEPTLLGVLPREHTPKQLADIVMRVAGGKFMAARFGLGTGFLEPLVSGNAADTAGIWQEAERIRQLTNAPYLTAAAVTAALIRSIPSVDQYLAASQIDQDDIVSGARWYAHLTEGVELRNKPRHDGGIGRDWSFGYTPLLTRFGNNLSEIPAQALLAGGLPTRDAAMHQVLHLLSQGGRSNVALVGALGSGKTALVHIMARRLMNSDPSIPHSLQFSQVIALDPSSLIANAPGRGELESLVQHMCYEAVSAKNTILFLDDAQLFFEDGNGAVNLSNVLMPLLESGALRLVMAMDEQRWLRIAQAMPGLTQYINKVMLAPTDETETFRLMEDQVMMYEYRSHVLYTYQSLQAVYRLSSRFLNEQVMPGRALKLLETAADFPEDGLVTKRSVEQAIEQTQGVKVGTADTAQERETLMNLEQLIHERMINQTHAVQVVSDALRRARAGVRNPERPIGTFLFLGPTGVGKTELAKSVAAVFFGGEERLVRLDLNEYSGPGDVNRLIADASQDQNSLTAQISRNPFSVVLLDEIEKAHPNVLNTLLQLLDEGILRDINNREVSFRDAVVIATSNAGADRLRAHIEAGEKLEQFEESFTDELINSNTFRPEFLNRFDEIVLFRPLTPDELLLVIDIILKSLNKNLAAQKLTLAVEDDAKRALVNAGYDPRLGARPMRRIVQRAVENIVANQMLSGQAVPGSQIRISLQDVQMMLQRSKAE